MATTRAQARASLKRWLGNRTDLTDSDYDMFLDDGLFDLTTRKIHLLSLERVGSPIFTSANKANYPVPDGAFAILHIEDTTNKRTLDRFAGGFEDFLRSRQNQTPADGNPPTQYSEFGTEFWLGPAAPNGVITLVPYYYARATWGTAVDATPGIEAEWHYAVLLMARIHAAQDIGDETRLGLAAAEWQAWFAQRDTSRQMQRRHNVPAGGVRPHPSLRDRQFGV